MNCQLPSCGKPLILRKYRTGSDIPRKFCDQTCTNEYFKTLGMAKEYKRLCNNPECREPFTSKKSHASVCERCKYLRRRTEWSKVPTEDTGENFKTLHLKVFDNDCGLGEVL